MKIDRFHSLEFGPRGEVNKIIIRLSFRFKLL
uniref:Uncharacterized protein n=1 Tax=Anguilla anguilla TaxID=7936 RepID=A0A0E9TVR2_ANGAN